MTGRQIEVWHIGGEDVRLRIPLLRTLREQGFRVAAVGSEPSGPFDAADIPYHRYTLRRGPAPLADVGAWRALHRLFLEHRPDVVHAFDTKPTYLTPSAARRAGVPGRVCTITGMGYLFSSSSPLARLLRPVYRGLQRSACGDSSITVFQNEDDREYFLRKRMVPEGRDRLVRGSGVDFGELMSRVPSDEDRDKLRTSLGLDGNPVVIMIARLVVQKGIREYLDAAELLRRRGKKASFLLVGPYSSEARGALHPSEIGARGDVVRYLGARNDVPALLSLSDICVLPSYYREGVPRVLLEAGALGLPLIATDMPGCRDVVEEGVNGALVPARNPSSLADAIARLLESKERRVSMGSESRKRVMDSFSLAHVAGAYGDIYRSITPEITG